MTAIESLIVANRGEIALRIIRTAQSMGIRTIAVYSDADAGSPHVRAADTAVRLPGTSPTATYLDHDRIIGAARLTGAQAVHPGYGFLSENAVFAEACVNAGLVFVGPSPETIELMGSKVSAKALMDKAGVPVLPGFVIDDELPADAVADAAATMGFPVLVKADAGGGGRGMRLVRDPLDLASAVEAASREAASSFAHGTVFLEKFVVNPRHVEVQIFGDQQGQVVHLFERDCSIQRRHQKVIEEAPAPGLDDSVRQQVLEAAVTAGRALGYVGAGTVEFVLDEHGSFFFLEVNTRLQVEHPVTEMITGLDLVKLQLQVAGGATLPAEVTAVERRGHAVEARLYAEDAAAGFLPTSGRLDRFRFPALPGLRVDLGYHEGDVVTTHYDAMLAKIVAWAPTRDEAVATLSAALRSSRIHGVVTNQDLLVATLTHPDFLAGRFDTGFFDHHDPATLIDGAVGQTDVRRVHALQAAIAVDAAAATALPVPKGVPTRWRNAGPCEQPVVVADRGQQWAIDLTRDRETIRARIAGLELPDLRVLVASRDHVVVELDGLRWDSEVRVVGGRVYVDGALRRSMFEVIDRHPSPDAVRPQGSLVAPMPGFVVGIDAKPGDDVVAGQAVLRLEAMKMEHTIRAPETGKLSEVLVAVGDQVHSGDPLAVVDALVGDSA